MTFLIFAVPIIVIIFLVIFVAVFASDSKKYSKNLDNSKQRELDRAREEALKAVEEMRRIKANTTISSEAHKQRASMQHKVTANVSNKSSATELSREWMQQKEQARKNIVSNKMEKQTINNYQKYYTDNYNKGNNKFNQQRNFRQVSLEQNDTPKLEFSRENLVRGLIAKEYLSRKQGGKV